MKRGKLNKKLKKKTIFNKKTILVVVIVVVLVAALIFYSLRPKRTPTKEELLEILEKSKLKTIGPLGGSSDTGVWWCGGGCGGADIDSDGDVDVDDFNILLYNWGSNDCLVGNVWCSCADINKDGLVNFNDYSILVTNWGRTDCGEEYCTDSDGGKNPFVKGTTYGEHQRGYGPEIKNWEDYCLNGGSNTYLIEYSCATLTLPYSRPLDVLSENYVCPDSCKDGACVGSSAYLYEGRII